MKGKRKGKQKGNAVLQKYMVAVGEFVKNKSGAEGAEDDAGLRSVKRKSRKELRKEKRKLKKIRMKSHYEGKKKNLPSGDGEQAVIPKKQKATGGNKKDEVKKVPKTNAKKQEKPKVAPTKTNRYQESRKKALLEANEQEDREIKKLERYLKLNKRKNKKSIPQSFVADGLDYILGALDTGTLTTGMYDSDDNMDLAKDNFKQLEVDDLEEDEKDLASDGEDLTDDEGEVVEEEEEDELPSEDDESMDAELEDENDINENEESEEVTEHVPTPAAGKYVPPHMRDAGGEQRKAELEKLKKNVKGLVNRLSEPNMSSIGGQLEALYMSRSRKDMNETLTEVLLAACVTPALMPNRLLMEHVLLVSILHHTVGLEVMMKRSSCPMIVKFHTGWMGRHSRDKIIDTITSELVCSFLKVVDTQLKSFSAEYNVMEVFQLGFKMRRKRKGKQKGNAVLQKYMVAVGEFVKNKRGAEGAEDDAGLRSVKRKSRKELRKEKRKLKKIRMKSHYEGKKKNLPSGDGEQAVIPKKQKATGGNKKDEVKKVPKTNTKKQEKPKVAPTKTNRYQESRKKALLEANEQEDREIKKLERYLKLNKRKNKKSIPQSFVADGLDYILGALDTGTLTTGMYDSDDNMDLAKDNFKQLEVDDLEEDEKDLASDGEDLTDDEGEVVEEEEEDELPSEDDESMDAELEDENDINENEESEEVTEHVPTPAAGKYVPPHMRDAGGEQRKAELEKLKKNVKGLVNRLSEPNMSSIGGQLEALYMSRSRKDMNETLTEVLLAACVTPAPIDMNETLTEVLLAACVTPALMPNRLLMEHVLLVSILHHTVGLEQTTQTATTNNNASSSARLHRPRQLFVPLKEPRWERLLFARELVKFPLIGFDTFFLFPFSQITFQFSLWDKFRELSNLPARTFNNLIQLVTLFLQKKCFSLSLLKVIEFGELDKAKVRFLRQVLTRLLTDTEPEDVIGIFSRISGIPQLRMLREGLKLFISHFLLKSAAPQDDS
ncbi:uncharacterized protein LOC109524093, partial [Hippocampus comes]|uniref:uncharacterized protein LOC109524093 n=1 Tax=Hippocampus comes TaxID=109280 RepID=UPI00094E150D